MMASCSTSESKDDIQTTDKFVLQNDGNFTVTGTITNAPNTMVILQDMPQASPGQQPQITILDSARTDAQGNFTLKGTSYGKPFIK